MMTAINDVLTLSRNSKIYMAAMVSALVAVFIALGENSVLGWVSTISGVICVILVAERKISNYYWGFINAALYGWISYKNGFFGDMTLNWLVYLPFQVIGFIMWSKAINQKTISVETKKFTPKELFQVTAAILVTILVVSDILKYFGGNHPMVDASNVVLSIAATILMANRYSEQWLCWIAVNVTGITMWALAAAQGGEASIAGLMMWAMFFINSVYGYVNWRKNAGYVVS